MTTITTNISITFATIISDAILPHSVGKLSSRILDAELSNKKAFDKIVENRRQIINTGNLEAAVKLAKDIIKGV